jgi:ArsR family transcriptional regulator
MKHDDLASDDCASKLKALADADRLRLVQILRAGPRNVSELAAEVAGDIANVSHHLQILRRSGIVRTQKQGRFVIYQLHPDVFAAASAPEHINLGCCRLELPEAK